MTRAYVCMKISEYPPPQGCGWGFRSRVGESGEDPGWNLSYSTRCCPVLLNRLLIRIISLFQCGLPKKTPILKNVLFCVVLVPETRDRPFSPPPIPGPKHSLVYSYTYTFEYHGTYPVHSPSGLLFASKHLLRFPLASSALTSARTHAKSLVLLKM